MQQIWVHPWIQIQVIEHFSGGYYGQVTHNRRNGLKPVNFNSIVLLYRVAEK